MVEELSRLAVATRGRGLPSPSGFNRLERFRRAVGRPPLRASTPDAAALQDDLCAWILFELAGTLVLPVSDAAALPSNPIKPNTLGAYVRNAIDYILLCFDITLARPSGLGALVSAAEQEFAGRARATKFAASPALVRAAADAAAARGEWSLRAAVLLGFAGLMRVGEYAASSSLTFDVERGLRVCDVAFGVTDTRPTAVVTIRRRKADRFNRGSAVSFVSLPGGGPYCVVAALRRAVGSRPLTSTEPLLLRPDGRRIVDRRLVAHAVKSAAVFLGLPSAEFGTHSLRAGGAARLIAMGVPPELVQLRGDWASPVFLSYLRDAFGVAAVVSAALAVDRPVPYDPRAVGAIEASISPQEAAAFMFQAQGNPGPRVRRPLAAA